MLELRLRLRLRLEAAVRVAHEGGSRRRLSSRLSPWLEEGCEGAWSEEVQEDSVALWQGVLEDERVCEVRDGVCQRQEGDEMHQEATREKGLQVLREGDEGYQASLLKEEEEEDKEDEEEGSEQSLK